MIFNKQDVVYVPVSTDNEMPPKGMKISVSFNNGKNFAYETVGKDWKKDEVRYTHWLKPVKDVFVLTEDEIEKIVSDAMSWYTKDLFIAGYKAASITNKK